LGSPCAQWRFSTSNPEAEDGNNYPLSPFTVQAVHVPVTYEPNNGALAFFGPGIVHTSSRISLTNSFSISITFSAASLMRSTSLIFFTPNDFTDRRLLNIMLRYFFF